MKIHLYKSINTNKIKSNLKNEDCNQYLSNIFRIYY